MQKRKEKSKTKMRQSENSYSDCSIFSKNKKSETKIKNYELKMFEFEINSECRISVTLNLFQGLCQIHLTDSETSSE